MYIDGVHIDVYRDMAKKHVEKMKKAADESQFGGTVLIRADITKHDGKYDADIWTCSHPASICKTHLHDTDGKRIIEYLNKQDIYVYENWPAVSVMEDTDAGNGAYVAICRNECQYGFFDMLGWFAGCGTSGEDLWDMVGNKLSDKISYIHAVSGTDERKWSFRDDRLDPDRSLYRAELIYNERNWLSDFSLIVKNGNADLEGTLGSPRVDFDDPGSKAHNLEDFEDYGTSLVTDLARILFHPEDSLLFSDRFLYSGTFASLKVLTDRLIDNGADEDWDLGYDNAGRVFRTILSAVGERKEEKTK